MSSVQVRQDPDSFAWEVEDASIGVHWSFMQEVDARDAAGTLEAMLGTNALMASPGLDVETTANSID